MRIPDTEPDVHVGLITSGAPLLSPRGEYEISRNGDGSVLYRKLNPRSFMRLENLCIGKGFHWESVVPADFDGDFSVSLSSGGEWQTVCTLPLERYITSVTASEMNPHAPVEFLKAHAVMSRSWVLGKILACHPHGDKGKERSRHSITDWEDTGDHDGFDVCSDDHCQRFQGLPHTAAARVEEAVRETRGIFLTDGNGNPADARFSKCCGGRTELFSTCWQERDLPYLISHDDPWCDLSGLSAGELEGFLASTFKNYDKEAASSGEWTVSVPKIDLARRLKATYEIDCGELTGMAQEERGPSGRIKRLLLRGTGGEIRIGKELVIRRLLSADCLRSSLFEAEDRGDSWLLRGRGWGHGVGLCQTGAAMMARAGKDFREILGFYFPGAIIEKIYR